MAVQLPCLDAVIPAKAGIHFAFVVVPKVTMDPGFRWDDGIHPSGDALAPSHPSAA